MTENGVLASGEGAIRWPKEVLAGRGLLGRFAYLVLTQVFVVGFGVGYWIFTARAVTAGEIGLAAAAVSGATFLSAIAVVGVGSLVLAEIGTVAPADRRLAICTGIAVAGALSALLAGLVWLFIWMFEPASGGSFARLAGNPVDGVLIVAGAVATTVGGILDSASIGLDKGSVQLLRNVVAASLRVAFVLVFVAMGARTATALLVAWAVSSSISAALPLGRLAPRGDAVRFTVPAAIAMVRRFWVMAFRHHVLNLSITSVSFFLPMLGAVLLAPREYAYFSIAQLISSTVMLVPALLAVSLFAEAGGDPGLLRKHIRRTLPIALACSGLVLALLEPAAGLVLRVFGSEYAAHGGTILRLLLLGGVFYVFKDHYVAIRRAQGRLAQAARMVALTTAGEAALTAVGGVAYGVDGLCAFWAAATVLETLLFLPVVLRVVRSPDGPATKEEPSLDEPSAGMCT